MLDIGCGVGVTTKKLLELGYNVDGLVPYQWMAKYASDLVSNLRKDNTGRIYECTFEDFKFNDKAKKYELAFFSESFQYINVQEAFEKSSNLLSNNGHILICDFFRTDAEGKSPLGGGHNLSNFQEILSQFSFEKIENIDITKETAPTIQILDDFLSEVGFPFRDMISRYFQSNYPGFSKLLNWKFKERFEKINRVYFSGNKNIDAFMKYKTYRLFLK